jgi:uncharacterized LabA/DUF88 family protein
VNKEAKRILQKYRGGQVGVFIDDANMFHCQKRARWQINWRELRNFLEDNFKVVFIKYYRGVYSRKEKINKKTREKHNRYSLFIQDLGFELIKRPLKKIYTNRRENKFKYKCDFDAEIGFDMAVNLTKISSVIVVSGDSDFVSLNRKIIAFGKGFLIICFEKNAPWEIRKIHHLFVEEIRDKIALKK